MTTPAEIDDYINTNINTNADGGITGAKLNQALLYLSGLIVEATNQARVITSSANTTLETSDYRIGLNRTSPAAQTITLVQPDAIPEILIQDLAGNLNAAPVTVLCPPGLAFSGNRTEFVMNEDNMTARFFFWEGGIVGTEPS